ncbi:alpha-xenorhabdolysin family binary toxin subunit A [Proteus myxofaciens]|uniref:Toxin n=1 Tax=Proteus myxofaciens ATCC 19692 TaxID=1354337 RepID=A0A198GFW3_9GAMM|nr:alpha-xenorhabdolysin family binary toxin subunit A [Proteus myxofaciens]OAT35790.1 hypothetical protein M983_0574 [Proteus myxofaciens ATCC 19692]
MNTTIFEDIDKVIENIQLPEVALSLILGKDINGGRSPGIFTAYDLNKIKAYVDKALILPYELDSVIDFLGYEDMGIAKISASSIQELFLKMREHAFQWNKIEYSIKQQAIDLEIIGREITGTGEQIILFISQMPLLEKINNRVGNLSNEELNHIKYTGQDKKISDHLITILESMHQDINREHKKTLKLKNMISDFRIKIIGGEDSNGVLCNSFYYDIIAKKKLANDFFNQDNSLLHEEKKFLEDELDLLKKEYQHFVKLAFTGLAFGIIGVIITGGIFGSKAEDIRKKKNETIGKITDINEKINSFSLLVNNLEKFEIELNEIEQFIKDANMALEHLEYMWQATLTEIKASLTNLKKIDNAMELIRFSIYFEKMISPWYMVVGYSKEMITIFDEALSSFYTEK